MAYLRMAQQAAQDTPELQRANHMRAAAAKARLAALPLRTGGSSD